MWQKPHTGEFRNQQKKRFIEENEIRETIAECFPTLSLSNKDPGSSYEDLVSFVTRFMNRRKESLPAVSNTKNDLLIDIKNEIMKHYPNRAIFHLLHRWGRRTERNFVSDAACTLTVISSNLNDNNNHTSKKKSFMTDFLLNCRVFEILPPTKNRNRLSYNFVAKEDTGVLEIRLRVNILLLVIELL